MTYKLKLDPQAIKRSQSNTSDRTSESHKQVVDSYSELYDITRNWAKAALGENNLYPTAVISDILEFVHETLQNAIDATTIADVPFIEYILDFSDNAIKIEVFNNGENYNGSTFAIAMIEDSMFDYSRELSSKKDKLYRTHGGSGFGLLKLVSMVTNRYCEGSEFYIGDNFETHNSITGLKIVF
jgi:hypothetical protein